VSLNFIRKAQTEGYKYPKPYGAYGEDSLSRMLLELIETLEGKTFEDAEVEELKEILIDAAASFLERKYPRLAKRFEALAELQTKAEKLAEERGVSVAVAKGEVLRRDKQLYRRLRELG